LNNRWFCNFHQDEGEKLFGALKKASHGTPSATNVVTQYLRQQRSCIAR